MSSVRIHPNHPKCPSHLANGQPIKQGLEGQDQGAGTDARYKKERVAPQSHPFTIKK